MKEELECKITEFLEHAPFNYLTKEQAIREQYVGMRIFDAPIFAYGAPDDTLFLNLKNKVIGAHFRTPYEWNDKAKTVVSIFFPFTKEVRESNGADYDYPSELWLHGRIEGQACLNEVGKYIVTSLNESGNKTVCPILDSHFMAVERDEKKDISFTSNWSERHVGFICGMGTFGLSKGIITKKGMAGRLLSVITECEFEKTERAYTEVYEYCIQCGLCVSRCPAHAITIEAGKNHNLCADFCAYVKKTSSPRFGCGKCQINVPCTDKIPQKILRKKN